MKTILSFTLVTSTLYTFSFWKMKQSGAYLTPIGDLTTFQKYGDITEFDFKKFIQRIENKSYLMYWYDEYSEYGFYRVDKNTSFLNLNEFQKHGLYDYFSNNMIVEKNIWPKLSENKSLMKLWEPKCFHFKSDQAEKKINDTIINNIDKSEDPLACFQTKDFEYTEYYRSNSGVIVRNTPYNIELKKIMNNGEIKTIDFETVFKKYVHSHLSYGDQIKPYIIDLKNQVNLEDSNINWSGKSIAKLSRNGKIFFRNDEVNLLNRSEILAIWYLIPTKYINKEYLAKEKSMEKSSEKIVNRMLIGLARNKDTGEVFHWVTDLGQDIEVLFDEFIM